MNELIENKEEAEQKILELQRAMMQLPQAEVITEHYFNNGMYVRKVHIKKDIIVAGKKHKTDHFFICVKGSIIQHTIDGTTTLYAGDVLEVKSGIKRIVIALEDSIVLNIHRTDNTDLNELENELIEYDIPSLFDADNKLKFVEIPGE